MNYMQIGGELVLLMDDGKVATCTTPHMVEIARGHIDGSASWSKLGYNGSLSNAVQDLWPVGGEYVFPTEEMGMEVVSSSAADDGNPAGTGVQVVRLSYLNNAFVEKSEDIILNGTTPVATVATDIYRVQNFRAKTVGSGGKAAGTIDIRHLSDTPIYSRISTGETRARNVTYTVPAGKELLITNVLFSAGSNVANRPVTITTKATYDVVSQTVTNFFLTFTELVVQDNVIDIPLEFPTELPAGTALKVSAISPDGATYASVVLRGWLEAI